MPPITVGSFYYYCIVTSTVGISTASTTSGVATIHFIGITVSKTESQYIISANLFVTSCGNDPASAVFALYNGSGKMLALFVKPLTITTSGVIVFSETFDSSVAGVEMVKVFVVNGNTFNPVAGAEATVVLNS